MDWTPHPLRLSLCVSLGNVFSQLPVSHSELLKEHTLNVYVEMKKMTSAI